MIYPDICIRANTLKCMFERKIYLLSPLYILDIYLNGLSGHSSVLKVFPDTCRVGKYFLFLLCLLKIGILQAGTDNLTSTMIPSLAGLSVVSTGVCDCSRAGQSLIILGLTKWHVVAFLLSQNRHYCYSSTVICVSVS